MRSDIIKSGNERAPHRSLLRATGVKDEDFKKPFIAIANSHVDIIPGHVHLGEVGLFVKECVRQAGGVPFIFNTIGVDDGIAMGHSGMKYSLPSREIIADSIESMLRAHCFDGMICIPNCDKIVPGMFMGALRCNIPTLFVSGGPMEAGKMADGRSADLISVFEGVGAHQAGKISDKELTDLEKAGCPTCGSCSGMFTANSMNCLAEALGMALPGNGTVLATSEERRRLYRQAARQIMVLVEKDIKPRDIVTRDSIDNAMILDMAMGGSTNTLLHVMAMAHEAQVEYSMDRINSLSQKTPNICKVSPSSKYHVQDVHMAGGIHTILGEIRRGCPGLLKEDSITVTTGTLGQNIDDYDIRSPKALPEALIISETGGMGRGGFSRELLTLDQPLVLQEARSPQQTGIQGGLTLGRQVEADLFRVEANEKLLGVYTLGDDNAIGYLNVAGLESGSDTLTINAAVLVSEEEPVRKILARLESWARTFGKKEVHLSVARNETLTRDLLRSLGFSETGTTNGSVDMSKKLDQNIASSHSSVSDFDPFDCIRTVEKAYSKSGGLSILYGNVAPEGSVVKTAGVSEKMLRHSGPAVIFESQEDACSGILNGRVKAGDVVVIRYEGPRGGPGMQEMLSPTSYIKGMGLGDVCALITDGRFSGGTAGACIGHISPEAANGGPIGLLKDGDIIEIDIPAQKLNVKLSDAELAERRKSWTPPEPRMNFGWLARYQKMVTHAAKGAVLEC